VTLDALEGGRQTRNMFLTLFRPKGKGPFPLAVIVHGRATSAGKRASPEYFRYENAARYFVRKGFLVLVPTRVGYGATGQGFDPEASGAGNRRDYRLTLNAASTQVLAAIEYGRALPDADAARIVLVGQSVGGFTTVASAAKNPPGLVAAINFAGGAGGDPEKHPGVPVAAGQLKELFFEMGRQVRVPMLWVYTENDRFFGPEYSKAWAKAFADAGGGVDFHLLPPFKENGHFLFDQGCDIWMPLVEDYLNRAGFREPGLIQRPRPTRFAAIDDAGKVPYIGASGREGYRKFLAAPAPRAFAVSSDGHWGFAYGDDALARALANCQRGNGAAAARLYAVDAEVVW
jgi:dienelactone hydrolase